MAVVATALTITPLFDGTKRMTVSGTVAANETVAVAGIMLIEWAPSYRPSNVCSAA